jgi:hypothetical protein
MMLPIKSATIAALKRAPSISLRAAQQSAQTLCIAYIDYKKVVATEETKREAIKSWRDTKLTELTNQREILELFLKETFKEREMTIKRLFDTLDKAIETDNDSLLEKSIDGILSISRQSPLLEAKALMDAMKNPDVQVIDI